MSTAAPLILELAAEHVPATLLRQQRLAVLVGEEVPDVDLDAGTVRFGPAHTFSLQLAGTVDEVARTFTWAWATRQGIRSALLAAATGLREYGREHDVAELAEAVWHVDDVDPFLLAAIARGWSRADAMVRTPVPGGAAYLLLGDVPLPPPGAHQVVQALTTGIALAPVDHRTAVMALCADNGFAVPGLDEVLAVTVGSALVTVAFTPDGRVDDVGVSRT
jgi:hypothetical protein